MSEEKHTPLPWTADGLYVTAEGGKPVIADCGRSPLVGFSDKRANVTLIVRSVNSVPALLKALEEISRQMTLEEMEAEDDGREDGADFIGAYDAFIGIARAALAAHRKES